MYNKISASFEVDNGFKVKSKAASKLIHIELDSESSPKVNKSNFENKTFSFI